MGVLRSELFKGSGHDDLENCAANHAFNFYQGKPGETRSEAIFKIQTALKRLGFDNDDAPGFIGRSTTRAILAYKGPPRMILGPGQTTPDAVVGIKTIKQLDKDIADSGLDDEEPHPTPLEFGSTQWRFTFFGNKGFFDQGIFTLFIGSNEAQDSQEFTIANTLTGGSLLAGFKGSSQGTFTTSRKRLVKDFQSAGVTLQLTKVLGGGFLFGTLQLGLIGLDENLSLFIKDLQDETIGESATSGDFNLTGRLDAPKRVQSIVSAADAPTTPVGATHKNSFSSSGLHALRRHTFFHRRRHRG